MKTFKLITACIFLSGCTINPYSVSVNTWVTETSGRGVLLQSNAIPEYDNSMLLFGLREVFRIKKFDLRLVNNSDNFECAKLNVIDNLSLDPSYYSGTYNNKVVLIAPNSVVNLGYVRSASRFDYNFEYKLQMKYSKYSLAENSRYCQEW